MKKLLIVLFSIAYLSTYSQIFGIKDNEYLPILNMGIKTVDYENIDLDGAGWLYYQTGTADTIILNCYHKKQDGSIAHLQTAYAVNNVEINRDEENNPYYVFDTNVIRTVNRRIIYFIQRGDVYELLVVADEHNFFTMIISM